MIKLENNFSKYNLLFYEINELYHDYAVKTNLSDSVSCILYILCERGGSCKQSEIYKNSGISRQTINSAVRRLEENGVIILTKSGGRDTVVSLTEEGESLAVEKIQPLFEIENNIFSSWNEKEISEYLRLTTEYRDLLKSGIENLNFEDR